MQRACEYVAFATEVVLTATLEFMVVEGGVRGEWAFYAIMAFIDSLSTGAEDAS
jgi:hypothetical protein